MSGDFGKIAEKTDWSRDELEAGAPASVGTVAIGDKKKGPQKGVSLN